MMLSGVSLIEMQGWILGKFPTETTEWDLWRGDRVEMLYTSFALEKPIGLY